uniref:Uncharacterized protein n=1 Tax=Rousettus aegyptiacus TaxID=9407 RepID=A0A7J8CI05_ROUAE|nr:hypothetical protein HJG63_009012 [Rousettus aegyptiacus]
MLLDSQIYYFIMSQYDWFIASSPHLSQSSTVTPLTLLSSGLSLHSSFPKFLLSPLLQPENNFLGNKYKNEVFQQGRLASRTKKYSSTFSVTKQNIAKVERREPASQDSASNYAAQVSSWAVPGGLRG